MNRYLFKAKRKDNPKEWVYGYLVIDKVGCSDNETGKDIYYIAGNSDMFCEVIPETICQYLSSINDIDLYENDIVKGFEDMYDNEVQGTVVLNLENGLQLHCKNNIYHFDYIYDFKVIGNKFDEVDNNE